MTNKSNKPVVEVHETPFAPSIKSSSSTAVVTTPSKTSAIPQVTFPKIRTFTDSAHPEFGNLRTVTIDGEPWFVGKDVAKALGYTDTNQAIRKHVDSEDKLTRCFDGSGQNRGMTIINESGLYSLILSSKLPSAKEFKRWITAEVLPSIRKTGGYINQGQEDVFVDTYLPFADENTKTLFRLNLQVINEQNTMIKNQQEKIKNQDVVIQNQKDTIDCKDLELEAKDMEIDDYTQIVTDLTKDVPLAGKRAILNRILRCPGEGFGKRYFILYREFDNVYHMNTKVRMNKYNDTHCPKCRSRLQFIDEKLGMLNELYELAAKLFKSDVEVLVQQMYDAREENF